MKRFSSLSVVVLSAFALGGCAVSGGDLGPAVDRTQSTIPLDMAALPPLPESDADLAAKAKAEKFSKQDDAVLAVAEPGDAFEAASSEMQQAYANAVGDQPAVTTAKASLKPFVGRWLLVPKGRKAKMQKIGAMLGLTEKCELVLEDQSAGSGFKAQGSSSCPTSLFMLDSWVALGDQLVLRDHMGDEIVKLRSRESDVWVGVNKQGETLVLNKS